MNKILLEHCIKMWLIKDIVHFESVHSTTKSVLYVCSCSECVVPGCVCRSLVALSLILALLLFKPAPLYILDEVDAALDLSHTQNIGHMLRTHFRHSQVGHAHS